MSESRRAIPAPKHRYDTMTFQLIFLWSSSILAMTDDRRPTTDDRRPRYIDLVPPWPSSSPSLRRGQRLDRRVEVTIDTYIPCSAPLNFL
jgi:hypothetical protein